MAKQDDAFAKSIIKSCGKYSDNVTRIGDSWKQYVESMLTKVEQDVMNGNSELESARSDASEQLNSLGNNWEDYASAYNAELKYKLMSDAYVEEVSQTISYAMFKAKKGSDELSYRLETYLTTSDKKFLHPNAVRYLLTKTVSLMKTYIKGLERDLNDNKDYFEKFEKNTFDDPETEDVVETADDLERKKVSIVSKWTKTPTGEQEDLKQKLRSYFSKTDEYKVQRAQHYVLGQGIQFINSLIEAFEDFYASFESKIDGLDKNIKEIYNKYNGIKGTTAIYVCASKSCLDKLRNAHPYQGSSIDIDSDLAKGIFDRVSEYAVNVTSKSNKTKDSNKDSNKAKTYRFFSDLFDKGIIGYFEDSLMKKYGDSINIDIISAIEKEAFFEGDYSEDDEYEPLVQQYVIKTIHNARNLSCPFIETPLGEATDPIDACTFNKALEHKRGDDSDRAQLVRKELLNFGGEPDEDVPINMIMFYKSFYGLRANDLSKFAPPEKSLTYNRSSGEYFKAYYELVAGIHPESHLSREISPHIDKWWHIVTKMPDLDEENQIKMEKEIYSAFFWGIAGRYIDLFDDNADQKIYKIKQDSLNMDYSNLIVSNGTDCDKLYEVLDAIAIYPELVRSILNKIDKLTSDDVNSNRDLKDGLLYAFLEDFSVEEPGLGEDCVPAKSIFSIPMLMKKSETPEVYYEEDVINILKVEIEEIRKYLERMCNSKELSNVMGEILNEQFEKYLIDLNIESAIKPTIYRESLFDRTCSVIAKAFEDIGLIRDSRKIQRKANELRN